MTDNDQHDTGFVDERRGVNVKLILAGVAVAAFVVFALQNAENVSVTFLVWDFQMRKIVLMVLSAAAGILAWELGKYLRRRRQRQSADD